MQIYFIILLQGQRAVEDIEGDPAVGRRLLQKYYYSA